MSATGRLFTERVGRVPRLLVWFICVLSALTALHAVSSIASISAESSGDETIRPLDWTVDLSGTYAAGQWVTFTHSLGPDPQSLHPVKVFDEGYGAMLGYGRYSAEFGPGPSPEEMFGDGRDGNLIVGAGQTVSFCVDPILPCAAITEFAPEGETSIQVDSTAGFSVGDEVLIIQMRGSGVGNREFGRITSVAGTSLALEKAISHDYSRPPGITLFRDANYGGVSETLTASDPCLDDNAIGDNTTSSLLVSGYHAHIYAECNFQGSDAWVTGDIPDLTGLIGDDTLSSIGFFQGTPSVAQVVRVPQYLDVTVEGGGTLTARAWDGSTGGVVVLRASGRLEIEAGAVLSVDAAGFRGGNGGPPPPQVPSEPTGDTGEGIHVREDQLAGVCCVPRIQGGGRGGGARASSDQPPDENNGRAGGGGAGHAVDGTNGVTVNRATGGVGGAAYGDPALSSIFMGAGGGGGGNAQGYFGGSGGGIILVNAAEIVVGGLATSNGSAGANGPHANAGAAGGGAGGSIQFGTETGQIGNGLVRAFGGAGGASGGWNSGAGGGASVGRILVEYCDSLSGDSSPPAATAQLDCYIIEQIESSPYDKARLKLPESFTGDRSYQIQFGRRYIFEGAGVQTRIIRLPKRHYTDAELDVLISGSGSAGISLDLGNDGTSDWGVGSVSLPAALTVSDVVEALNAYLESRTDVDWGDELDMPVRVSTDAAVDVLLTNLVLTPVSVTPTPTPTATATTTPPTPSPTPTATTPPGPGTSTTFLPLLSLHPEFVGPWEQEPNNSISQANGPLISGRDYFGHPNDLNDYFILESSNSGEITVSLTGHTGQGLQLLLYYESGDNLVRVVSAEPYFIEYDGEAGRYYVRIYSTGGFNTNTEYTLRVTYP